MRTFASEFNVDEIGDEWETLVSAGQMVIAAHDRNRWVLGDIAAKVTRRYGENSLKKFASDINCRPSTMYDYHRVSTFYDPEHRVLFPALTWSHYREAMRAGDVEDALGWLEQAQDNNWFVEDLKRQINTALGEPAKPRKLADCTAEVGRVYDQQVEFKLPPDVKRVLLQHWIGSVDAPCRVRLVVYDLPQESSGEETHSQSNGNGWRNLGEHGAGHPERHREI